MPQGAGVIIKHLLAPDSGALDKVYGIDWNRLDDVLRGAHAQKLQHLGLLRIADDTIVITAARHLQNIVSVDQDLDPDAGGTRDLGDATNYWDDCWFDAVNTDEIFLDIANRDVRLLRGAANRLDLGTGDSFNIVNGSLMLGGTVIINASRIMSNIVSFNQALIPQGGGAHDLGDVANYWDDAFIDTIHTDNVVERTLGAGVTIDGVLLQDTEVIADRIWFDKSSQDVSIYRGDADLLKTDDDFSCRALYIQDCLCIASGCVAQNLGFPTKTGAFSDSDFTCPKDGLIGIDETNNAEKLYFRAHGDWFHINKSSILLEYLTATPAIDFGLTRYFAQHVGGTNSNISGTEADVQIACPRKGILKRLKVRSHAPNTLNGISTITVRINGNPTPITVSIGAGATGIFSDNVNTATINEDDLISIQIVTGGSAGSIYIVGITLELEY